MNSPKPLDMIEFISLINRLLIIIFINFINLIRNLLHTFAMCTSTYSYERFFIALLCGNLLSLK